MVTAFRRLAVYWIVFLALSLASSAAQAKRIALIIGNGAYKHVPTLNNPENDAVDMSAALKRLGFQVLEGRDLDEAGMRRTVKEFAEALVGAEVGLFFYAGHGLQVDGRNYLVPIDAKLESAAGLDFEVIRLDVIHRTMERETTTNVIFLDACRDNPLSRNLARAMGTRSAQIGKGLAAVESGVGTLISFSTQPGNFALDGTARNSPFAASLIRHIRDPKEDLSTLLIQVRNDVMAATNDRQIPWEHSALRSKFYFGDPPGPAKALGPSYEQQLEQTFWDSVRENTNPDVLSSYLERYPNGTFAERARALTEQHRQRLNLEAARRHEELKRQEQARAAAEVQRLDDERRRREAALAEQRKRADAGKRSYDIERLKAEQQSLTEALNKAKEEARVARAAAEAAERERLAAAKAEERAKDDARKAKTVAKPVDRPTKTPKAETAMCRSANGWVAPCSMMKDGAATRLD